MAPVYLALLELESETRVTYVRRESYPIPTVAMACEEHGCCLFCCG